MKNRNILLKFEQRKSEIILLTHDNEQIVLDSIGKNNENIRGKCNSSESK